MRWFRFRGGVHPEQHKVTGAYAVRNIPLPERLFVPLQQHIGAPARPVVAPGDAVLKGALIAEAAPGLSAPVHAPTSGRVVEILPHRAPHPSGLPVTCVVIAPDGHDRWCQRPLPVNPLALAPEAIAERVRQAGIVGMGGAAFPSAVKLDLGQARQADTLIINGGECEPYLTCDDRLMQERSDTVILGVRLMLRALGATRALIAVEENKPRAQTVLRAAARRDARVAVIGVPTRYPMGSEKQMIHFLTGREVPAGGRSADIGVVVHNVATVHAVAEAVARSRPLVSRIVTVAGGAVRAPANLEVPIGTLASHLVAQCGGLRSTPARQVLGGPMMGITVPSLDVPITKGTNGVLLLHADEVEAPTPSPCIRCGRCVSACPIGLVPLELAARARAGDLAGAADQGLADCIGCGSCSYVCPASIPLTQYFSYAKGALADEAEAKRKAAHTRALAEARRERLEHQAQAKKEAAARRKAERAAKTKQQEIPA